MKPILGTAMWGWTIPRKTCFDLLDAYYENGFKEVDTATNYPINKKREDFRKSEQILAEWIRSNGVHDLEVMMKVGSINNLGVPDNNLSLSFLLMNLDNYKNLFDSNLNSIFVHWDNRADLEEIKETFDAFKIFHEEGLSLGLSGIKHPKVYAPLMETYQFDFRIQIKHNILYSDYDRYQPYFRDNSFIAYGINAGGLKLNHSDYRAESTLKARGGDAQKMSIVVEKVQQILSEAKWSDEQKRPRQFYQIGLIFAFYHPNIDHVLLGPSNVEQLQENLNFMQHLTRKNYQAIYHQLVLEF